MDYHNHEREINLKSMLFAVLYQWRKIILVALILAVVLGGFKGIQAWGDATNEYNSNVAKNETAHQEAMEVYEESRKTLELQIEDLQANIKNQQEYLENSVVMAMDPRLFYTATASFYIYTEYQIMPDMVYQNPDKSELILASYLTLLNDNALLSDIAQTVGLEIRYLKELVSVYGSMEHMLTISVQHEDKASAEKIKNLILGYFVSVQPQVGESIGAHSINEVMNTVGPDMDIGLSDRQKEERSRLKTYSEELVELEEQLAELEEPKKAVISQGDVLKSAVKYAVVGGVLGVMVTVVAVCVWYVLGTKVFSATDLRERFRVRIMGTVDMRNKRGPIETRLRRLEGRETANVPGCYDVIAANVRNYAGDAGKLLVTGDADQELISMLVGAIQSKLTGYQLICCGNIIRDTPAIESLMDCDAVLLVECVKTSRYSNIADEAERISDVGKRIVGAVVFEK